MGNGSTKSSDGRQPLVKTLSIGDAATSTEHAEGGKPLIAKFDLTIPQRKKIVDVWTTVEEERDKLGGAVLKRIFIVKPDTKTLFRLEALTDDRQLADSKMFTKASRDIVTFFGVALKYLNLEIDGVDEQGNYRLIKLSKLFGRDHLKPNVVTTGAKHATADSPDVHYWQLFPNAVVEELDMLRDDYSVKPDVKSAWLAFANDLTFYAKSSYDETKKRQQKQKNETATFKYVPAGME